MPKPAKSQPKALEPAVPLHLYISRLMDEKVDLTNVEVARHLGYARPNVIAMLRTGSMKLPLTKVKPLAEILGIEPASLLQRTLMEYDSELWGTLQSILGGSVITTHELALISEVRRLSGGMDPDLAHDQRFLPRFLALVQEALDNGAIRELGKPRDARYDRNSATRVLNDKLEALCLQQAQERIALRKRLLAVGGKVAQRTIPAPRSS